MGKMPAHREKGYITYNCQSTCQSKDVRNRAGLSAILRKNKSQPNRRAASGFQTAHSPVSRVYTSFEPNKFLTVFLLISGLVTEFKETRIGETQVTV